MAAALTYDLQISFNPTMVRLLLTDRGMLTKAKCVFQSHNGAIAAKAVHAGVVSNKDVSIPQWCDCCA